MGILLIIIVVVLLLGGGGGYYGYRSGSYGPGGFGGIIMLVLVIAFVLWLVEGSGFHGWRIGALLISPAYADSGGPAPTIDLTGIAVAATGGFFSILGLVVAAWLQSHIKDQAAAVVVANAVKNSLGAMQQAATVGIKAADITVKLPAGTPPLMAVGVQYVLDHADEERKRLGITNELVLGKVNAAVGLAAIATNLAVAGNDTSATPRPLDPVPLAETPRPTPLS